MGKKQKNLRKKTEILVNVFCVINDVKPAREQVRSSSTIDLVMFLPTDKTVLDYKHNKFQVNHQ